MIPKRFSPPSRLRCWLPLLCAAAIVAFAVPPAHATFIITAGTLTQTAAAGSTGNYFDVTLTNTSPTTAQIFGAFSFSISTDTPNIQFTSATTATAAPYIFDGDSLFAPTITALNLNLQPENGQTLNAVDESASGNGDSVAAGATVGLGRVYFDVASGTPAGPIIVTLASYQTNGVTSLTDGSGNPIPSSSVTEVNGAITITATPFAASPEPATLTYCMAGLLTMAGRSWWRRRRSIGAATVRER